MKRIKVLLADDKEVFREGLARLLLEQPVIEVVYQCDNSEQAIKKARETRPDVVLMNTVISEGNGIDAARQINGLSPNPKVAMLTDSRDEEDLFSAIEAGATGYLLKDMKVNDLVNCIDLIVKGEVVISPPLSGKFVSKFASMRANRAEGKAGLSKREIEILGLLAKGATNKEVAKTLFIAENTAKVHLKNILEKLQLRNRQQAAAYAVQHGLVADDKTLPAIQLESTRYQNSSTREAYSNQYASRYKNS